jgi:hypothetical protein
MIASKKKRYLCVLLLILCSCSQEVNSAKADFSALVAQLKQTLHAFIVRLEGTDKAKPEAEQPVNTEPTPPSNNHLQAQAQLMGAMENMAAMPTANNDNGQWTAEDINQYHQDFNKAATADEKRDALIMLVKADTKNVATILRDAYADLEPEVRKEAVLQMHAFNNQKAVIDLLLSALNDPDPSVAIEAVEGLGTLHDQRVIASLKKMATNHPDELIRAVAQDYVGGL